MKNQRIYIAGSIHSPNEINLAAEALRELGFNNLVLPHEFFTGINTEGFTPPDYMKPCIKEVSDCDLVLTLDGFERDEVATAAVTVARMLQKRIVLAFKFITDNKPKEENHSSAA